MVIREITAGDLDAVAGIAQAERLLLSGPRSELWSPAGAGHHTHPLLLRRLVERPGTVGLVDERPMGVAGAIIAVDAPGPEPLWVVEEYALGPDAAWDGCGRTLLAALAARATGAGVQRILVPCLAADSTKAGMLAVAGLTRTMWVRHRANPGGPGTTRSRVRPYRDPDASGAWTWRGPPAVPLTTTRLRDGLCGLVIDDGATRAAMMIAGQITAPAGFEADGAALLAGPFAFDDGAEPHVVVPELLGELRQVATERDAGHLLVSCWADDPGLDAEVALAGYHEALAWWQLRVGPSAPSGSGQLQPEVAPHSAHP